MVLGQLIRRKFFLVKSLPTSESKYKVIEKLYLVILCTIVVVKFFLVKILLTSESKYRVIEKLSS